MSTQIRDIKTAARAALVLAITLATLGGIKALVGCDAQDARPLVSLCHFACEIGEDVCISFAKPIEDPLSAQAAIVGCEAGGSLCIIGCDAIARGDEPERKDGSPCEWFLQTCTQSGEACYGAQGACAEARNE